MAKIHHLTLKAAVEKYQPLVTEGKTEAEIKEAIASDEKEFDEDAVSQIYQAIVTPNEGNKGAEKKHIVTSPFRDKSDFTKAYNVGDEVSHFDAERLAHLVTNKLVELK